MTRRPARLVLLALGALLVVRPAAAVEDGAFEVVTRTGEVLSVSELADTPGGTLLLTRAGRVQLPPDAVDFLATFRRNLDRGRMGNALWFRSGRWLRFESLEFEPGGRLLVGLGERASVRLPEAVVDFRASVLEGGPTLLPRASAGLLVAKSLGPAPARPPEPEEPSEPDPEELRAPEPEERVEAAGERRSGVPRRRLGDR
jgi:hypothetical protein